MFGFRTCKTRVHSSENRWTMTQQTFKFHLNKIVKSSRNQFSFNQNLEQCRPTLDFSKATIQFCLEYLLCNLSMSLTIVNQSQVFQGNSDKNTPVTHNFTVPIYARFVRIFPITWYSRNCMRFELYGCKEGEHNFKQY